MKWIARLWKNFFVLFCCTVILSQTTGTVRAEQINTTLRVAFFPLDGFFEYDAQGRESGYGVDLLNKLSQYTGIEFEYVPADSWESTKHMLLDGKADIRMPATMPYTPSTTLSYNRIGILDTYDVMVTRRAREDLYYQDYDTIRTLKIAVSENFYKVEGIGHYFDDMGVTADQIVFCSEYNECYDKLVSGEVDALVSNVMDMNPEMKMLVRFNSISNYISTTFDNPYLEILDKALTQIKLDEPLFLHSQYEKWFPERVIVPLTFAESSYLASLESITFAFQPNEGYLAHKKDGEYYGIYPELAKYICRKLGVTYRETSLQDCQNGLDTADVYAGFFYDQNYAEQWDLSLSAPINDINYYMIQKKEAKFKPETCRIAVIDQFRYTSDYIKKRYENAQFLSCSSYEECLKAIDRGRADMTIINNYIAEYYLNMYQFSDLSAKLSTDYSHLFCFAAADHNEMLASILTKAAYMITEEEMQQLYIMGQEDRPESNYLQAVLHQNPLMFTVIVTFIGILFAATVMSLLFARKSGRQKQALAKALSEKNSFLARMSHDMRTPMNGILGLSYLMEQETELEGAKGYIPELRESGEYLLQMINDVLDINRIESGKLTLKPRVCDERQLFHSVISMLAPLLTEKEIDFHFEKRNIDWKYMMLDEQRVKQVFVNLLSNAIKFTPRGGRIDLVMELVSQTEHMIRDKFIIRDTGVGMGKEFLPHVFEPFCQEERTSMDNVNGTGMGMAIVKQLVELMGGTITIKSEENKGTEITLFLNFPLADKPEIKDNMHSERAKLPKGLRILLCEDHPLNAKIAVRLLEQQQAEVTWAENGRVGVEQFTKSAIGYYDAILMDIRMPVLNGLEAARIIRTLDRADAKTVPIIAMTANAYDSDRKASMDVGMNQHLEKPVTPEQLYEVIAALISAK